MASLSTAQMVQDFFLLWVYYSSDWRLFIDSSKKSLKCVLLCTGNKYELIPVGHSIVPTKGYSNIKVVLERLKYCNHHRLICVDLKMINFLSGLQGGHTIYPCFFLCYWDSGAYEVHWVRKQWPSRNAMKSGEKI